MSSFSFSHDLLDPVSYRQAQTDDTCGGYVCFEGWVRNHNADRPVIRLEYQAYEAMGAKEGQRVLDEALAKFKVNSVSCVHRTGTLEIGDLAVWVGVSAHHRDAAFSACRYIIDEIKLRVPIWKKEHYSDGDSGWINNEQPTQVQ